MAYDTNNDGTLQKDEIYQAYSKYKGESLSKKEINGLFAQVDDDGSGTIQYTGSF